MPTVIMTAEVARTITDDVLHNAIGEHIILLANRIVEQAKAGIPYCNYRTPSNWVWEQRKALRDFFKELGYETELTTSGTLCLHW